MLSNMFIKTSEENLNRKFISEEKLRKAELFVDATLPVLPDTSEIKLRPLSELAYRAASVTILAAKGESLPTDVANDLAAHFKINEHLTQFEKDFLINSSSNDPENKYFQWQYECSWTLLWVLGLIKAPLNPREPCNPETISSLLTTFQNTDEIIKNCKILTVEEILDETDFLLRLNYSCEHYLDNDKIIPENINYYIVKERLFALLWIINFNEWEDKQAIFGFEE